MEIAVLDRFNPTMVRLRLFQVLSHQGLQLGFNPTMVRLRRLGCDGTSYMFCGFNPTMVRLRPRKMPSMTSTAAVSIPLWCDCDG